MDDPREFQPEPTGQSTRWARRKAIILPAVVALAVAGTAGAILLPGAFAAAEDPLDTGKKADSGQAAQNVEQPEYPLPDLPPLEEDERYNWSYGDNGWQSDAADEYGAAFLDWFAAADFEFTDTADVEVQNYEIWKEKWEDDGSAIGNPTGESVPIYTGWGEALTGDELGDILELRVHPKASFKPGPGEGYEYLATCTDYEESVDRLIFEVAFECEETDGPGGSRILTVAEVHTNSSNDDLFRIKNTAVLYRADGTAVVVSDEAPATGYSGEYPIPSETTPHFSVGELTELAQSMPDVIVEG